MNYQDNLSFLYMQGMIVDLIIFFVKSKNKLKKISSISQFMRWVEKKIMIWNENAYKQTQWDQGCFFDLQSNKKGKVINKRKLTPKAIEMISERTWKREKKYK